MTSASSNLAFQASLPASDHIPNLVTTVDAIRSTWESDITPLAAEYVFGYGRFLGEHYCDWVTEVVGWKRDAATLRQAAVGTMLLRSVAVLRDYVIDTGTRETRYATAAADFRTAALVLLGDAFNLSNVSVMLAEHEEESERLDACERRRHWHSVRAYDEHDFWILGRKTTVCYLPLEMLTLGADVTLADALRSAIHARNIAVQILDDICDWREDLAVGNITLPLWCAITNMGRTTLSGITESETADFLYASDAISVLLTLSRRYLSRAAETLAAREAPSLVAYLARLDAYVQWLAAQVIDVVGHGGGRPAAFTITDEHSVSMIAFTGSIEPLRPDTSITSRLDLLLPLFAPRPGLT